MDANKAVDANVDLFQPMAMAGRGRSVGRLVKLRLLPAVGYLVPSSSSLLRRAGGRPGGREPDTAETNRPLSGEDHWSTGRGLEVFPLNEARSEPYFSLNLEREASAIASHRIGQDKTSRLASAMVRYWESVVLLNSTNSRVLKMQGVPTRRAKQRDHTRRRRRRGSFVLVERGIVAVGRSLSHTQRPLCWRRRC